MARWTPRQVEQLAPDDRSIKAARKLARPGPWSDTGSTETLVWGKCQGSGSTPYQVSVDLTGPGVKCTCPSRKFPCKHGVALLMLWADSSGSVADIAEPAGFAGDWAAGRADKSPKSTGAGRARSDTAEPVDPQAAARRLEQRLSLMSSGVAEFETWLADLYRQGLAAARRHPYAFWDAAAARLLDGQLPGLANRVRALPGQLHGREDWADHVLVETGRWFSAVQAWHQRDRLDPDDHGNLRAFLGWPMPTAEVKAGDAIDDAWMVEGVHRTDDGRLQAQRTWLRGERSGERLMVLDFAAVGAALGVAQVVGSVVETPLVAYPGSGVRRALFVDDPVTTQSRGELSAVGCIDDALEDVAARLAANPFADQFPVALDVAVVANVDRPYVVDAGGRALRLVEEFDPWPIVALTGDTVVPIFGEMEDGVVRPVTAEISGRLVAL